MSIDSQLSLADLAIQDPRRTKVFATFGLDYCCNGNNTLAAAVASANLDLDVVRAALIFPTPAPEVTDAARNQSTLAHDIVDTHHAFMWEEMPRLAKLVALVDRVHSDSHPELAEVHEVYTAAIAALEPHMTTEERVIFPAISRMEKSQAPALSGSFAAPIAQLRDEHTVVGELFGRLRALTNGYAIPHDACTSYQLMLEGLKHMELDLHEHIHKENNILFPRVLELEKHFTRG